MPSQPRSLPLLICCLLLAACASAAAPAPVSAPPTAAPVAPAPTAAPAVGEDHFHFEQFAAKDGASIEYAVATPAGYDPAKSYRVLLALPPGGQDHEVTASLMRRLWADEGVSRGWVVLSPVAPGGRLYFDGSERYIPELLDATAQRYRPEGGTYFLAGISNGGLSAFRIILNSPERFRALLVLPGFPYAQSDKDRLAALKGIPVALYVGADDSGWREESQTTYDALVAQGGRATLDIVPGESHIIRSLTGRQLFDRLDGFAAGR